jgi:hypothetical protein
MQDKRIMGHSQASVSCLMQFSWTSSSSDYHFCFLFGKYMNTHGWGSGRGIAQFILISALHADAWSTSRPGRFTRGVKTPSSIEYEVGWIPEPVCTLLTREKSLGHAEIRTPDSPTSTLLPIPAWHDCSCATNTSFHILQLTERSDAPSSSAQALIKVQEWSINQTFPSVTAHAISVWMIRGGHLGCWAGRSRVQAWCEQVKWTTDPEASLCPRFGREQQIKTCPEKTSRGHDRTSTTNSCSRFAFGGRGQDNDGTRRGRSWNSFVS